MRTRANKLYKFILSFIGLVAISFLLSNMVLANQVASNNGISIQIVPYSEKYQKWLNLSEEDKANTVAPSPYATPYTKSNESQNSTNSLLLRNVNTYSASDISTYIVAESSYDLRDYINIKPKNQYSTSDSWAFATMSAIETNISLTRGYAAPVLSPRHLSYGTTKTFLDGINEHGYNRELGGTYSIGMILGYLTSGYGPVTEFDMPFQNSTEKVNLSEIDKSVGQTIEGYIRFPTIYKQNVNGTIVKKDSSGNVFTDEEVEDIRNQIKTHIKQYGAVVTNCHVSEVNYYNSNVINQITSLYCNNNSATGKTRLTIIGWDDNYSKTNFRSTNRPAVDGAWLVLYSQPLGAEPGYFYVSYEDLFIEEDVIGFTTISDREYINIYQHDTLGGNVFGTISIDDTDEYLKTIYAANLFTKELRETETLKRISVKGTNIIQTVDIYVNKTGELNIENSTLVASNISLGNEYKTITLTSPIELTNNKFAVIVKYTNDEKASIALETNTSVSEGISGLWDTATNELGESFISEDGVNNWKDLTEYTEASNLCIKAYTVIEDDVAPTITFETNSSYTYKREQSSVVNITDENGVNNSTLRYIWIQSRTQPDDTEFNDYYENGKPIINNTDTGNNWYLWVTAKDNLGNQAYKRAGPFYLDNTPPTMPTITSNTTSNVFTSSTVQVRISGSSALSGIDRYEYTTDGGVTWNTYSSILRFEESGIYEIKARAVSNTELISQETESFIVKIDKEAPVITGITEGETYTSVTPIITDMSNVTATLTKDGRTSSYTIDAQNQGETINTTGTYKLTVTDEVGNTTTVNFKIDATPPTVPQIVTNATHNVYTKEDVEVSYTGSFSLGGIAGYEYSLDNGYTWNKLESEVIFNNTGIYTIKGRAVSYTNLYSEETVNFIIKIDKDFPLINGIVENGVYGSVIPIINDVTNVTATLTKDGVETSYNINEDNEGEEITETGTYKLTVTDEVGNQTSVNFKIEATAPVVTFTPNGNSTYQTSQSTKIVVTDDTLIASSLKYKWVQNITTVTENLFAEGASSFVSGDTITLNAVTGEYYLIVIAKDSFGNTTLAKSEKFCLDNELPTVPNININVGNGGRTNQNIVFSVSGSYSASGIKNYQYSLNGGSSWTNVSSGQEVTLSQVGTYSIIARAVNNLNKTSSNTSTYTATINRDLPTITFSPNGSSVYSTEHSTIINVTHTSTLDQETFKYIWTTTDKAPTESQFKDEFFLDTKVTKNTGSGIWYLWARAEDIYGHYAEVRSQPFYFDNGVPTAPTITATSSNNSWSKETVNVSFSGSNSASGINKYRYSLDNQVVWTDIKENENLVLDKDGIYTIYAQAINNVKKIGSIAGPYVVKVDKTAPKITGVENNGVYVEALPIIEDITNTEITLTKNGTIVEYKKGSKITESGNYILTVKDELNHITTVNFIVDKSGPEVKFEPNGNTKYGKSQTTKVSLTDVSQININSLRYKWVQGNVNLDKDTFMKSSTVFSNGDNLTISNKSGNDWYLWVYAKDEKGNETLVKSKSFYLDNEIPKAPKITSTIPSGQYTRENVNLSIIEGSTVSGISKYQFSQDNGKNWTDVNVGDLLHIESTGIYNIIARAVNNVGTIGKTSEPYVVKIDKDGPIINFSPNGNDVFQKEQMTKINVEAISQINTLKYLWSQKAEGITETDFVEEFVNGEEFIINKGSGDWYLWALAIDDANNITITKSNSFKLDNDIPEEPILKVNTEKNTTITKTLEIEVSGSSSISGISKYQYSLNNGATWIDIEENEIEAVDTPGSYIIKARAINNVGTEGKQTQGYPVTIAKTAITVTYVPKQDEKYKKEHSTQIIIGAENQIEELKYLWSQAEEGIKETDFTQSFVNKQTIIKNNENGTFYLWVLAKDTAGNRIIQKSDKFNFDNQIPTVPDVEIIREIEKAQIKISGSQSLSGIAYYQYTLNNGTSWKDIQIGEDLILDTIGKYELKVRAVNNVGTIGEETETKEIEIAAKIPTISFTQNGNDKYQTSHKTNIEVLSYLELDENNLKYFWSDKKEGITEEDFKTEIAKQYIDKQEIKQNIGSGTFYIWAMAKNIENDTVIQRSEEFNFDNDKPIIENITDADILKTPIVPQIKDETTNIATEVMKDGQKYDYEIGQELNQDGIYQIFVIDEAGNTNNVNFAIQIKEDDVIGPIISFSPNENKNYKSEQKTTVTVTDESEIKELKYLWSAENTIPEKEEFTNIFKNGETIINNKDSGEMYLWVMAEDILGNISILRSNEFYLDNTVPKLPEITTNIESGETTDEEVIIEVKTEEELDYEYSIDGGKNWNKLEGNTITITEEGTYEVIIVSINKAGLRSEVKKFIVTIVKKEPVIDKPVIDEPIIEEPIIDEPEEEQPIIDKPIENKPEEIPPIDDTVAKDPIPQTGISKIITITIAVLSMIAITSFIKLKKIHK